LIDIEIWDFLSRQKRKDRQIVEQFLHQLAANPERQPDGEDADELRRPIALFVARPFVLRVWRDSADRHWKVLQITRA
jgi:hypothetical protein